MIKELISALQANPENRKARERVIELVIERDYESWIDWGNRDLADTIADLERGAAEPLCKANNTALLNILLECPDCGKVVDIKTAVENENFLRHKKCFLNSKPTKKKV